MQPYYNVFEVYTNPAYTAYNVDLTGCNSVQLINKSTNGAMIINNFFPLLPGQSLNIDGNKMEVIKSKLNVFPVGVTFPNLVVVKKIYI